MLKQLFFALILFAWFGVTVMWATSYTHYTSVGIDHDQREEQQIKHSYYRLRWPGNGSISLGGGKSYRPLNSSKPFETLDLAATFLYPEPELPEVESIYNKAGFWYKSMIQPSRQFWLGVPAWLPVIILGFLSFVLWRRRNTK